MSERVAIVLTAKSIDRILRESGTSSWRLDRNHARQCEFAVCTRNAHADWVEGPEAHRAAFLIGKIKDVVPSPDHEGRFLIAFTEYAQVNVPDVWKGERNPVKYANSLEEIGIDRSTLKWKVMPAPVESKPVMEPATRGSIRALTMAEAKEGLARAFGVEPDAIEITIRG